MWFTKTPEEKFLKAVSKDDVKAVRALLEEHPEFLDKKFDWNKGNNDGFLLNYAAFHNSPKVIEFLVKEKHADPNFNKGVSQEWTPLHHAEVQKSFAAAAMLLELGADPEKKNDKGANTVEFFKSRKMQDHLTPSARIKLIIRKLEDQIEKKRLATVEKELQAKKLAAARKAEQEAKAQLEAEKQKRIDGEWKLTGQSEVTFTRELPDGSHSLTDIFNFQTRIWRAVVTGLKGQGTAQNVIFFDQIPDPGVLRDAFDKLKELGGKADESALPGLSKKPLRPAPQP